MLLAVSDVVYQALIAAVVTVTLTWMAQRAAAKVAKKVDAVAETAKDAAAKVVEVKEDLQVSHANTDEKLDTIHTLVNGHMKEILHARWVDTELLAELDPKYKVKAAEAKHAYDEHVKGMAKADEK